MKQFEPTFESLREHDDPLWFRDAKLSIWSHWGPQSVPMCGDWYARNMYIQGTPQYLYHIRHYGHPSKFGYKDICALWKAERFDPDRLMDKYIKAGAKYFVAQATHHDHFFNYDSAINPMNSVNVGPEKDNAALWQAAVLCSFDEGERVLTAQLPDRLPTEYVPCLAVALESGRKDGADTEK